MKTGFIGMGIMGSRMAANLVRKGFDVVVYNRTGGKCAPVVAAGAKQAFSVKELVTQCDAVFTMLSTPEAVMEISDEILADLKSGGIWADCSTVGESMSQELSAKAENNKIKFIDAPVAGSLMPAETAQLVFLCGGDEDVLKIIEPQLAAMGRKTVFCGPAGKGSAMKMVVNMLLGQAVTAMREGLKLGNAYGFETGFLLDNLGDLPVMAPVIKGKINKYNNEDYSPEFPLQWMQKDLHVAAVDAYRLGISLPQMNTCKEIFMQAREHGFGEEDIIAVNKI